MDLRNWSKSELEYGKKVLSSGLLGALSGQQEFLDGQTFTGFLADSLRMAVPSAAIGVCVGFLGSCSHSRRNSMAKALTFGLLGGAIGFAAGVAWESRRLASSAAHGASRNVTQVRDERWMKKHSIAYA